MEAMFFLFIRYNVSSLMIEYHYNFLVDIKAQLDTLLHLRWHKEHNIVVLWPNPFQTLKIVFNWFLFKKPLVKQQYTQDEIHCYWVSGGVWGSYNLPNKIYICPRKSAPEFIEEVIEHEIVHLQYEKNVQGMNHEEKEDYINTIQKERRRCMDKL